MLDTPGHKIYMKEMITTLSINPDAVTCLVISVKPGEYEAGLKSGTTIEDLIIIRASNIKKIVVLLNKIDLLDFENEENI